MVLPDGTDRLGKGTFRTMRAELLPAAFADSMRALLGDEEYTSYIRSFGEDWKPGLRANGLKIRPEQLKAMLPWQLEPVPWRPGGILTGWRRSTTTAATEGL